MDLTVEKIKESLEHLNHHDDYSRCIKWLIDQLEIKDKELMETKSLLPKVVWANGSGLNRLQLSTGLIWSYDKGSWKLPLSPNGEVQAPWPYCSVWKGPYHPYWVWEVYNKKLSKDGIAGNSQTEDEAMLAALNAANYKHKEIK